MDIINNDFDLKTIDVEQVNIPVDSDSSDEDKVNG